MKNRTILTCVFVAALGGQLNYVNADLIQPGPNVQERTQEALILAETGSVVEFGEGLFEFTRSLSLDVDGVTVKGQGPSLTILSFKHQNAGSEGLLVTSDGVTLRDFAVEDTIGDAIKVKDAQGITFFNVRTEWTGGPKPTNGSYGFYPVSSKDVLIDECVAIGASDAGIYVGQSDNIIVRNSTVEFNVAGIEIENCYNADVHHCVATHNTAGILVFDLPNLPQQGGHNVRVFDNDVMNNDTPNFAPEGNIVGRVPMGSGIIIMANRNVEVFNNTISENETANLSIFSYRPGEGESIDSKYYPYPTRIHIHHNSFGEGGRRPDNDRGRLYASIAGTPLPDIVWDGAEDGEKRNNGNMPGESGIVIHDNGDATFVNLNLIAHLNGDQNAAVLRDIKRHEGTLPPLKQIKIPGDS